MMMKRQLQKVKLQQQKKQAQNNIREIQSKSRHSFGGIFCFWSLQTFVFSGTSPAVTTRFRRGGELRQTVPLGLKETAVLLSKLIHSVKITIFT